MVVSATIVITSAQFTIAKSCSAIKIWLFTKEIELNNFILIVLVFLRYLSAE